MKKPLIGITPGYSTANKQYELEWAYTNAVLKAGGVPVMLPYTSDPDVIRQLVDMCDGFLFCGGHDVDPALYGADPWYRLDVLAPLRDMTEREFFGPILESKKPVVGVCRGMQIINCLLGGSLYQDLPTEFRIPDDLKHLQTDMAVKPTHKVKLVEGAPLAAITGMDEIMVNSFHHQGIKELSPKLVATAHAEDGLIEAAYMPDYPYMCLVQWHPEELFPQCKVSQTLFEHFIKACEK